MSRQQKPLDIFDLPSFLIYKRAGIRGTCAIALLFVFLSLIVSTVIGKIFESLFLIILILLLLAFFLYWTIILLLKKTKRLTFLWLYRLLFLSIIFFNLLISGIQEIASYPQAIILWVILYIIATFMCYIFREQLFNIFMIPAQNSIIRESYKSKYLLLIVFVSMLISKEITPKLPGEYIFFVIGLIYFVFLPLQYYFYNKVFKLKCIAIDNTNGEWIL